MTYLGDLTPASTLTLKFTTVNTTGTPTNMAGSPAVVIYRDSVTTNFNTGVTLTTNFNSKAGLNNVKILTTNTTNFVAGSDYQVMISSGTVAGVSVVGYVVGQFSLSSRSAIRPTTAGRTLDVSSTGEAGVDWANVGSPTTTVDLSGTTIKTSQQIGSVSGSVGSVTGAVGSVTGAVGSIAAGGIAAASFAAGAIDATAIAANAIGASELAADAASEIAAAVWDLDATAHQTAGTFGQAIGDPAADTHTIYGAVVTNAAGVDIAADIIAVQADTDDIQTRLPAALVSGRMDASVGAMAANTVTAAAIADGAIDAATFAAGAIDATAIAANAIGASELAADAAMEIADALLDRNMATGTDTGADNTTTRTVRQALRALRNKVAISAGVATVYKEDDATASWTSAITTSAGNPITMSDPT